MWSAVLIGLVVASIIIIRNPSDEGVQSGIVFGFIAMILWAMAMAK